MDRVFYVLAKSFIINTVTHMIHVDKIEILLISLSWRYSPSCASHSNWLHVKTIFDKELINMMGNLKNKIHCIYPSQTFPGLNRYITYISIFEFYWEYCYLHCITIPDHQVFEVSGIANMTLFNVVHFNVKNLYVHFVKRKGLSRIF